MSESALYVVSKQSILRQIKLCEGMELTLTCPPQNARLSRSFSKGVNFDQINIVFSQYVNLPCKAGSSDQILEKKLLYTLYNQRYRPTTKSQQSIKHQSTGYS